MNTEEYTCDAKVTFSHLSFLLVPLRAPTLGLLEERKNELVKEMRDDRPDASKIEFSEVFKMTLTSMGKLFKTKRFQRKKKK